APHEAAQLLCWGDSPVSNAERDATGATHWTQSGPSAVDETKIVDRGDLAKRCRPHWLDRKPRIIEAALFWGVSARPSELGALSSPPRAQAIRQEDGFGRTDPPYALEPAAR